jgi:hypothetical protein
VVLLSKTNRNNRQIKGKRTTKSKYFLHVFNVLKVKKLKLILRNVVLILLKIK